MIPIFPVGRAGSLFVQSIFDDNKDFFTFPTFNPIYSSIPKTIKTDKKSIKFFCLEFWNRIKIYLILKKVIFQTVTYLITIIIEKILKILKK